MRALTLTIGLWAAVRASMLWSGSELPLRAPIAPMPVARAATLIASSMSQASPRVRQPRSTVVAHAMPDRLPSAPSRDHAALPRPPDVQPPARALRIGFATPGDVISSVSVPASAPSLGSLDAPLARVPHERFTLSVWSLVRSGSGGDVFAPGAQLGGSQTGLRFYAPVGHGIALTGQANTPLARPAGAEASLGVALRLAHLTLLAERRIAIGREGRNDYAFTVTGGVDQVRLPASARLDAYAQAGVVGSDGFADGAVRVERAIAERPGLVLAAGVGIWGGIQPGVRRIDIGPQFVAHLQLGPRAIRIGAEWRDRVAGNARPLSGPALTLGADF